MSMKLYSETDIQSIANAIRNKTGETGTMKVSEMASKITGIPSGVVTLIENQSVTLTGNGSDVAITTADLTGKSCVMLRLNIGSAGHVYDWYRFSVGLNTYEFQKQGSRSSTSYTHNVFIPISGLTSTTIYLSVTPYSGSASRTVTVEYIKAA